MNVEGLNPTTGRQSEDLNATLEAALRRRRWKYRLISAGIRVAIYAAVMAVLFGADKVVVFFVHDQVLPQFDGAFFQYAVVVGRGYATRPGLMVVGLCVLLADRRNGWRVVAIGTLGLVLATGVTELGKETVDRVRPERMLVGQKTGNVVKPRESGERSFPSGHATASFSLYATVCRYYPGVSPLFLLLAIGCSVSRILLLKHYPSDIFAGALVGYYVTKWVVRSRLPRWLRLEPEPVEDQSGDRDS